jgi:hypothetical protein
MSEIERYVTDLGVRAMIFALWGVALGLVVSLARRMR